MSTHDHTFHCPGPMRRETLLLGSFQDRVLPGAGRSFVIEEAEILWVRDDRASVGFFWDGEHFKDGATLCSPHQPLTSPVSAIHEAREDAGVYRLTTADRLEIRVTASVFEIPALLRPHQDFGPCVTSQPEYLELTRLYTGTREELGRVQNWGPPAEWDPDAWYPGLLLLSRRTLAEEVVWSSRWSEAENLAALEAFLARFGVNVRDLMESEVVG